MKFNARVRAVVDVEFKADVPELDLQPARDGSAAMVATNEDEVLEARAAAVEVAEVEAKKLLAGPGLVELTIEEVTER